MSGYWFWLDLEMTGLDPQTDRILEAAALVTRVQPDFEVVAEFESAVFQPQHVLDNMNEWSRRTHGASGLTARVPQGISEQALDAVLCELADGFWTDAPANAAARAAAVDKVLWGERERPASGTAAELDALVVAGSTRLSAAAAKLADEMAAIMKKASGVILCGNSIGQDRKFVDRYLPQFASRLHYRMLDVSSFKIVHQELYNRTFKKQGTHRALDDIRESIAELQFYLSAGNSA